MAWFDRLILMYRTIRDNGSALPSRKNTNFIGATIVDDPVNDQTNVTIPSGGAPSGPAGGVLGGTYPNPSLPASVVPAAMAIDWAVASVFTKTLAAGANTFTFANSTDGYQIIVIVTGAASTLAWPTVKWSGGVVPTQSASGTDVYTFVKAGSTIYGSQLQAMA